MKIAIVLGTRPEIIKLAPIIFELEKREIDYFTIHTGQHYSENMDRIFWETLEITQPKYLLNIRENSHAKQTALMLDKITDILMSEKPQMVLVQGDTNSTLSGALAASKLPGISIAHLEAGLRSYDRTMPEEVNRIIVDHISTYLLAPTEEAIFNLKTEGLSNKYCINVGNTVEDMLVRFLPKAEKQSQILNQIAAHPKEYLLLTAHRQENTNDLKRLRDILDTVFKVAQDHKLKVIFPIHPRTRTIIDKLQLSLPSHLLLIDPVGYFDFLMLQKNARVIATDSGGVQEESCILKVPCLTLRENTERPETVRLGANKLVGIQPSKIQEALIDTLSVSTNKTWTSPYGGGTSANKVVDLILDHYK